MMNTSIRAPLLSLFATVVIYSAATSQQPDAAVDSSTALRECPAPSSPGFFDQTAMDAAWDQAAANLTNSGIDVTAALLDIGGRVSMSPLEAPDNEHPTDDES